MKNDLKHLRRSELIDLIYEMKAGSIADAAVQLSGVFQAAQEAADSYLKSIKAKEKELARLTKQAKKNMRDYSSEEERTFS